jgi:hypothetical protein
MKFFISLIGYVFSLNDMWVLENTYEETGYTYLCILPPKIQNAFIFAWLCLSIFTLCDSWVQIANLYLHSPVGDMLSRVYRRNDWWWEQRFHRYLLLAWVTGTRGHCTWRDHKSPRAMQQFISPFLWQMVSCSSWHFSVFICEIHRCVSFSSPVASYPF